MAQQVSRELAAIMFTDIVGYTAMMQSDENHAFQMRKRHRKILENLIESNQGQLLQYFGDGSLSKFRSAIDAVNCAVEIQKELRRAPKIPLRIGIHIGDIVRDQEGIYGDGVNVASRVENLSVAGGILISDKVFDEIKNHREFDVLAMGNFELKNVKRPVELFALANKGLTIPSKEQMRSAGKDSGKTVAVLPFLNVSSDTENEYFSLGISEEIINVLTRIDGLYVTARTSSFAFRDKNLDIREIGAKLGVSYILEGSVRKSGSKVRIAAQLINTEDGFHLFSEVYDRDVEDIFGVQDEISLLIANRLRENLEKPRNMSKKALGEIPSTTNTEAYDLYLKGSYQLNKGSLEGAQASIPFFETAIEKAPDYVNPYAGLSMVYLLLGAVRKLEPTVANTKAREYALKAIGINSSLAQSHMALGRIYFWYDWDMVKTQESIKKAIQLNPGSADSHSTYSMFLTAEGKLDDALVEAQIAINLDPLPAGSNYVLGTVYLCSERFEEAIQQFEQTLLKAPIFEHAYVLKAIAHLCAKDPEKALDTFNKIPGGYHNVAIANSVSALVSAQKGEFDKVYENFEKIREQEKSGATELINWSYTLIYLALNEVDKMFLYLEKCLQEKVPTLLFIRVDPLFKNFRKDQRFVDLIKRIFNTDLDYTGTDQVNE